MMPFGSECCKGSKLHVDLFLESYTRRIIVLKPSVVVQ